MDFDGEGPAAETTKKESNYVVLTKEMMLKEQTDQINRVAELFEVCPCLELSSRFCSRSQDLAADNTVCRFLPLLRDSF